MHKNQPGSLQKSKVTRPAPSLLPGSWTLLAVAVEVAVHLIDSKPSKGSKNLARGSGRGAWLLTFNQCGTALTSPQLNLILRPVWVKSLRKWVTETLMSTLPSSLYLSFVVLVFWNGKWDFFHFPSTKPTNSLRKHAMFRQGTSGQTLEFSNQIWIWKVHTKENPQKTPRTQCLPEFTV